MSTRDDIHKLRQALDCACKNNEANLIVLDDIRNSLKQLNITTLRANWTTEIGNKVIYTYEPITNNVLIAEFYTGATLIFTQTFTYDVNNNCISIITT
jgi:hypothetical protein